MLNSCQGRPDGPCPNNRRDATVQNTICDLFLCSDCLNFREPLTDVISREAVDVSATSEAGTGPFNLEPVGLSFDVNSDLKPCQSELLCFVMDKCNVMAADQLAKLCTDFYKTEEVMAAKSLLDKSLGSRMTKRTGGQKIRKTVEDIIRYCLDPTIILPQFYAVDLSRLPPVDVKNCDVSSILRELQSLCAREENYRVSGIRLTR